MSAEVREALESLAAELDHLASVSPLALQERAFGTAADLARQRATEAVTRGPGTEAKP